MRLSIELENFQVLKSKGLVFAQFWSKFDHSSFDSQKIRKNIPTPYLSNMWYFIPTFPAACIG